MKLNKLTYLSTVILLSSSLVSCEDFLDKEPPSYVVPEDYYSAEDQIQAVANKFYPDVLPRASFSRKLELWNIRHGQQYGQPSRLYSR